MNDAEIDALAESEPKGCCVPHAFGSPTPPSAESAGAPSPAFASLARIIGSIVRALPGAPRIYCVICDAETLRNGIGVCRGAAHVREAILKLEAPARIELELELWRCDPEKTNGSAWSARVTSPAAIGYGDSPAEAVKHARAASQTTVDERRDAAIDKSLPSWSAGAFRYRLPVSFRIVQREGDPAEYYGHDELAESAHNPVTPPKTYMIEMDREDDGRWVGGVAEVPGSDASGYDARRVIEGVKHLVRNRNRPSTLFDDPIPTPPIAFEVSWPSDRGAFESKPDDAAVCGARRGAHVCTKPTHPEHSEHHDTTTKASWSRADELAEKLRQRHRTGTTERPTATLGSVRIVPGTIRGTCSSCLITHTLSKMTQIGKVQLFCDDCVGDYLGGDQVSRWCGHCEAFTVDELGKCRRAAHYDRFDKLIEAIIERLGPQPLTGWCMFCVGYTMTGGVCFSPWHTKNIDKTSWSRARLMQQQGAKSAIDDEGRPIDPGVRAAWEAANRVRETAAKAQAEAREAVRPRRRADLGPDLEVPGVVESDQRDMHVGRQAVRLGGGDCVDNMPSAVELQKLHTMLVAEQRYSAELQQLIDVLKSKHRPLQQKIKELEALREEHTKYIAGEGARIKEANDVFTKELRERHSTEMTHVRANAERQILAIERKLAEVEERPLTSVAWNDHCSCKCESCSKRPDRQHWCMTTAQYHTIVVTKRLPIPGTPAEAEKKS